MTSLDYSLIGEVSRLTDGCRIASPRRTRDRFGRWQRDDAGELDWLYSLSETERAYILRNYFSDSGVEVDVLASANDLSVDEWAVQFVAAVRAARDRTLRSADVFSDEWEEAASVSAYTDDVTELLGPWELADLLEVKRDTVYQWSHRQILPEPDLFISGNPLWFRSTVVDWAVRTGRLPAELA